jgi:hypothetical protein
VEAAAAEWLTAAALVLDLDVGCRAGGGAQFRATGGTEPGPHVSPPRRVTAARRTSGPIRPDSSSGESFV